MSFPVKKAAKTNKSRRSSMGNTATQGVGVCLFFIAFALISAGIAFGGGMTIAGVAGAALLVVSCIVFRKAKASEGEG